MIWLRRSRLGPEAIVAALILLLVTGTSLTRGFGWFLITLFAVPFLLVLMLAVIAWSVVGRRDARSVPLALLILAAAPLAAVTVPPGWDWIAVTIWASTHGEQIAFVRGRGAVLRGWGGLGWSNFSYVAVDQQDALGTPEGNERWLDALQLDCPLVATQRIRKYVYLVTTADCPFEGVGFSGRAQNPMRPPPSGFASASARSRSTKSAGEAAGVQRS